MGETEPSREAIEAAIQQELMSLEKDDPIAFHKKLNNLWMRLIPYNSAKEDGSMRATAVKLGNMDRKLKDYIKPMDLANNPSVKRLEQTSREFFETIDSVLEELDADQEIRNQAVAIKDLQGFENLSARETALHELNSKIIPVYARLRSLGYNESDLT